jgi:hypothetical protein
MPRSRLEPGTFGLVTVRRADAGRWRASCQLRDFDGDLCYINRVASTRGRAEAAAQEAAGSMRDALVREHAGLKTNTYAASRVSLVVITLNRPDSNASSKIGI